MENEKFGKCTITNIQEGVIRVDLIKLAKRLSKCYAQKAPWEGYHDGDYEEMIKDTPEFDLDKYVCNNYDYVEWIQIDAETKIISWGQGDFVISCKVEDIEVEYVKLHYAGDIIDPIWIKVKSGKELTYEEANTATTYIVEEDGFIGTMTKVADTDHSGHWDVNITAKIVK